MAERHLYTNRLVHEKSPYLLQHAHNPVDWFPWGEDAFFAAKQSEKPIFLSIGYATCHWCHVMEKESFEDLEVAHLMNETFINIKVDREELPEVDSLYMEFAQSMMQGAAGWPLNVILTPDLQPFFAATYLPPKSQQGMMGLTELIARIKEVWEGEERDRVLSQAEKIVEVFGEGIHTQGDELPEKEQLEDTAEMLFKMADPIYGGIKGAPKFPIGYQNDFLLHYSHTYKDSRAVFLVERTLDMMQRGGIYDHLGGGFSRYSVDEKWLVPHFEKMLYDNALLIQSYMEAWQVTGKPFYREIGEEIIGYILREMTHPEGGFYSAEDADSEGHEGRFYTWTLSDVQQILGEKESELFCRFFDITEEGNFEGRNILHTPLHLEEFASKEGTDVEFLSPLFAEQKKLLWKARENRVHPLKDDKIISSWNGLMIHSLAQAGCAFEDQKALDAAIETGHFIRNRLWKNGRLLRRWREDEAQFPGGLDEYAYLIRALITLFEVTGEYEWIEWAFDMTLDLQVNFKAEEGAFYQTDGQDPNIILRRTQFSDGAEPSGNAVHCENLLRLYQITNNSLYLEQAEDILCAVKKYLDTYSPGYAFHLMNLNRYYDRHAPTLVIALNRTGEWRQELQKEIFHRFIPHKAVIWRDPDDIRLFDSISSLKEQNPIEERTTLYLCHQGICKLPLNELPEMIDAIRKL